MIQWLRWLSRKKAADEAARPLTTMKVVEQHADHIYRKLQMLRVPAQDLDDLWQEVVVEVHKSLHTFDRTKPMEPWLGGICWFVVVHHYRVGYRKKEKPGLPEIEPECPDLTPERMAAAMQAEERLDEILGTLDEKRRTVFIMFEREELSCAEIAKALDLPLGTVHSRLSSARDLIAKAFERQEKGGRR